MTPINWTLLRAARRALEEQHLAVPQTRTPKPACLLPRDDEPRICPRCRRGRMSIRIEVPPLVQLRPRPAPAEVDTS